MKRILLSLLVTLTPCLLVSQTPSLPDLSSLYREIDEAISRSADYVRQKERTIDRLYEDFRQATDATQRLMLAEQLFWQYKPYKNDSALCYAGLCISLADSAEQYGLAHRYRALMARQCSNAGMYMESADILRQVDKARLDREGLTDYYDAAMHLCGEVAAYTLIPAERDYYYAERDHYRDSLMAVVDPASDNYLHMQMSALCARQLYQEALKVSDKWLDKVSSGSHEEAYAAYYRHIVYDKLGNQEMTRYWLARSALDDIRCAVMDQASLITLAQLLNYDGDLERSYRYIRFTWQSNSFFNTRMRASQISPVLNVIEHSYLEASRQFTRLLIFSSVAGTVLALLLLVLFHTVRRQKRRLAAAQSLLQQKNDELEATNRKLQWMNDRMVKNNKQLFEINHRLQEERQQNMQ